MVQLVASWDLDRSRHPRSKPGRDNCVEAIPPHRVTAVGKQLTLPCLGGDLPSFIINLTLLTSDQGVMHTPLGGVNTPPVFVWHPLSFGELGGGGCAWRGVSGGVFLGGIAQAFAGCFERSYLRSLVYEPIDVPTNKQVFTIQPSQNQCRIYL